MEPLRSSERGGDRSGVDYSGGYIEDEYLWLWKFGAGMHASVCYIDICRIWSHE